MENKSAPPRKITRRRLLHNAAVGAGLVVASEALKPLASLIPTAQAAEKQQLDKDPGLVEGKEREFQIKQLKGFLGEFVTPQTLKMFGDQGLLPEDLKVKTRNLPRGGSATSFEVQGTDGLPYTVGLFVNRPDGLIREATIFADRGKNSMNQFADGIKTWLKVKDAEFTDMLAEPSEDEEPVIQVFKARQPVLPQDGGVEGNTILTADIPPPPIVYKHPDLNVYYAISQNSVTLYPDGRIVFHREMESTPPSSENSPV